MKLKQYMSYPIKVSTCTIFLNTRNNVSKYYIYEMEGIIFFSTKHLAQNPEKVTFLYFVILFLYICSS